MVKESVDATGVPSFLADAGWREWTGEYERGRSQRVWYRTFVELRPSDPHLERGGVQMSVTSNDWEHFTTSRGNPQPEPPAPSFTVGARGSSPDDHGLQIQFNGLSAAEILEGGSLPDESRERDRNIFDAAEDALAGVEFHESGDGGLIVCYPQDGYMFLEFHRNGLKRDSIATKDRPEIQEWLARWWPALGDR